MCYYGKANKKEVINQFCSYEMALCNLEKNVLALNLLLWQNSQVLMYKRIVTWLTWCVQSSASEADYGYSFKDRRKTTLSSRLRLE